MFPKTKYKKNKLTTKQWDKLKCATSYFVGECHHLAGKPYEYLSCLLPLSMQDHRFIDGNGHFKNYKSPDKVPEELKSRALKFWKTMLDYDDWLYFEREGLL